MEILGNGVSFNDVEKLRKQLVMQEMTIFERREKITQLTDELRAGKAEDMQELEFKRIELINDKEQQTANEMTKKQWETHVRKKLTISAEQDINEQYKDKEIKINEHERRIQLSRIHRDNLKWKLINRLTYAQALFNGPLATEQIPIESK